jgi:Spy/CpxP family protein refolding chaperone
MKNSLILASLLALSSLSFAAAPAAPASAPTPAAKKAAHTVKKHQANSGAQRALHMKGVHRVVTPRKPTKSASAPK